MARRHRDLAARRPRRGAGGGLSPRVPRLARSRAGRSAHLELAHPRRGVRGAPAAPHGAQRLRGAAAAAPGPRGGGAKPGRSPHTNVRSRHTTPHGTRTPCGWSPRLRQLIGGSLLDDPPRPAGRAGAALLRDLPLHAVGGGTRAGGGAGRRRHPAGSRGYVGGSAARPAWPRAVARLGVPLPRFSRHWILPFSMFVGSFAWSFVFVSLPFYIEKMSTVDAAATLRWTGWILGVSSLVTVVTAPFSARLFGERHPKRSFVWTQLLQGSGFFLMALARTLPELFFSRMLLGFMGAVSTFAFIMAGRSGRDVRRGVASIQSGMTLGQVLGPAVGAFAAARIGFRGSFVVAGFMLWACAAMVAWGTPYHPMARAEHERPPTASVREVATVCLLVLSGSMQIFFLTAMLPQVLPRLGVSPPMTLEVGGLLLFATGAAAALGSFIAPRLGEIVGDRRTIVWFLVASSVGLAALALASGAWSFGAIRFLQVLCISPVFPLSVAAISLRASGTAIGIVNSSRIAAAFLGPVLATTLLAWMPPGAVYLVLAVLGLTVVPLLAGLTRGGAANERRA